MDESQALLLQRRLRRLHRRLHHRQRAERPRVEGLTDRAVQVLGAVARAERPCRPGEIAEELGMAPSNVATALRELEATAYVSRARDDADGRQVQVAITEAGTAVVDRSRAARAAWLRAAVEATLTGDEQQQLLTAGALLDRVAGWRGAPR